MHFQVCPFLSPSGEEKYLGSKAGARIESGSPPPLSLHLESAYPGSGTTGSPLTPKPGWLRFFALVTIFPFSTFFPIYSLTLLLVQLRRKAFVLSQ